MKNTHFFRCLLILISCLVWQGCMGEHLEPEFQRNMLNSPYEKDGRLVPEVIKVIPEDSSFAFARYVTVFFNERMNRESVEEKCHFIDSNSREIKGIYIWGTERGTYHDYFEFYPEEQFESSREYRLYIEKGAKSYSGFEMARPFEWKFTMNRRFDPDNPLKPEP